MARGAWAAWIGIVPPAFSYVHTVGGGRLLIPLFGRPLSGSPSAPSPRADFGLVASGVVQVAIGLFRRESS